MRSGSNSQKLRGVPGVCLAVLLLGWPDRPTRAQEAPKAPLQQTPEGRAAAAPQPMDCTGSITGGDGKVTTVSNCSPAPPSPATPAARKRFPYPGESSPAVAAPAPANGAAVPGAGSSAVPAAPAAPTARRFPYPGEPDASGLKDAGSSGSASRPAAGAADNVPENGTDAGSSSSSSSSSGSRSSGASSSGAAAAPDDPSNPFAQPDTDTVQGGSRKRRKLPPVARQSPSEREEEDVRIAGFYQNDGNFAAAYGRAQDAVSLDKDDPEAHLALAEAARRLGKLDEAQKHYHQCLELDPLPKHRKVAERALKEMSGGA